MQDRLKPDVAADRTGPPATAPDLTIVVPTLNERENLEPLLALVAAGFAGSAAEANPAQNSIDNKQNKTRSLIIHSSGLNS